MEQHKTTMTAPGRLEADGRVAGPAVKKRAWFIYAVARLAVARNLAVAVAIAAMCVGAVGLTLWAIGVRQRTDAAAAQSQAVTTAQVKPEAGSADVILQFAPYDSSTQMVDFNKHPELFVPVSYTYKCGHTGSFIPADSQFTAVDPSGYKARLEKRLCPSCQAQAVYRTRKAAKQHPVKDGQADAAR